MTYVPEQPVRISILSEPSHLRIVRAATEQMCQLLGFDPEAAGRIVLSVDEALTNIIRHAYDGARDKPIEVELIPLRGGLRICLRDYGPGVDVAAIKPRDLKDIRPGGLGVHIMKKCMDGVEYELADGGGTLLTMTKNLLTGPGKPGENSASPVGHDQPCNKPSLRKEDVK